MTIAANIIEEIVIANLSKLSSGIVKIEILKTNINNKCPIELTRRNLNVVSVKVKRKKECNRMKVPDSRNNNFDVPETTETSKRMQNSKLCITYTLK